MHGRPGGRENGRSSGDRRARSQQAERALHLCWICTSHQLCEVPAKTATEMTGWATGHVSLNKAMSTLDIGIATPPKTLMALKCRLRLGADMVADLPNPNHIPSPCFPFTARARRELRPRRSSPCAPRPGSLCFPDGHRVSCVLTMASPGVYGPGG